MTFINWKPANQFQVEECKGDFFHSNKCTVDTLKLLEIINKVAQHFAIFLQIKGTTNHRK